MTTPPFDPKYTVYKTVGGSSRIGQNNQTRAKQPDTGGETVCSRQPLTSQVAGKFKQNYEGFFLNLK